MRMGMRADRKRVCIVLGILLFMTGCSGRNAMKPGLDAREREQERVEVQEESAQEQADKEPQADTDTSVEDDDFYVQYVQNLHQGNGITYADGYYYFRSQTKNYSLCRTRGRGMSVEVVADQMPGSICVREDQVYFINLSDGRTLYRVGTDGSGLEKLSDFPMQELIVLGDRIYFRSVYDREYDPFYQLTEDAAEDDRYLYSMQLDGSGCRLLVPKVCREFVADEEWLYYLVYEDEEGYVLYRNSPDGKDEEKILCKESQIWDILPYQGDLYWVDVEREELIRLNAQGEEEILTSDAWRFTIARGQAYVMHAMNEEQLRGIELSTGEDRLLARRKSDTAETRPWFAGNYNRGIFVVNGQVFARYFESEDKGVLWHILEEDGFAIFEDMEPLRTQDLVLDTSFLYEANFYYPGRKDEDAQQYLDTEGEFYYEESFGIRDGGSTYGDFSVRLPKFNSRIASYEKINEQMEYLMELALKDKDNFFQEFSELDQDCCISWRRTYDYDHLYVGETYISMHFYMGGYEGGIRDWKNSVPLIFDRETGLILHMDDLFTVDERVYIKRLTSAVYKYCEMTGADHWNESFDNNVLAKNLKEMRGYLTPDGIVLCYERYEVQAGCSGSPTFEIPYAWFADIFKE